MYQAESYNCLCIVVMIDVFHFVCEMSITPPPPCKLPHLAISHPPRETVTSMFF